MANIDELRINENQELCTLPAILGEAYGIKFDQTQNIQDLEDAIKYTQAAVDKTPCDDPDLPIILNNLGSRLRDRYNRIGNMQDLEDAIKHIQAAVDKTPSDHHDLPGRWSNLGVFLSDIYDRMGNMQN